jgi:uncharacterized protein YbjT (DUF2867 family)
MKKISVIITGATGMIGESVVDQCLKHESIERILVINRRPSDIVHLKLKELIHADLNNISPIAQELNGYDACFFCVGVSSLGMAESLYYELTYALTMNFAKSLASINNKMTFCYISGAGTDSTEKGKSMWARVKGKTENDLMKLPFKAVYNFRPAALIPYLPVKPTQTYQSVKYMKWLLVLLRPVFPNAIIRLQDFGLAMINSALYGYSKHILEVKDIRNLAKQ